MNGYFAFCGAKSLYRSFFSMRVWSCSIFLDVDMISHRLVFYSSALAMISAPLLHASSAFADELLPIVVTASRSPVSTQDTLSDFVIISHEEIERAGHSSLPELLQAQRGVQIDSYGGSGNLSSVHLRGASNSQAVMLLDGVRIESSSTGGPIFNLIPLSIIDHIEIVFGSQSTLYGANALGGVIQIFTQQGGGATQWGVSTGYGSFGTSQESANMVGALDSNNKMKFSLGLTQEKSSGFNTIAANNISLPYGYPVNSTGYKRIGLNGRFTLDWTQHHQLGLKIFSSADHYQFPGSDGDSYYSLGSPYSSRINSGVNQFTSLSVFSNDQIAHDWNSQFQITKVFNFSQLIDPSAGFSPGSNDSNSMPETDLSWQNKINVGSDILQVMMESRVQSISTQYSFDQSGCSSPASCNFYRSRITNSIASSYSLERGSHLMTVSIREDAITGFDDRTNGGVAYGYKFASAWKGVVDLSTGYRVPTYGDLYYPYGSNPNLVPEVSRNSEIGVTYDSHLMNSRLFVFQNIVRNFIEPSSNSLVSTLAKPINLGSVRLKGASYGIDIKPGKFSFSMSLDFIEATDENTGRELPRVAKFATNWKLNYHDGGLDLGAVMSSAGATYDDIKNTPSTINTPCVLFNLYGSYKLDKNWTVFSRFNNILNTQYQTAYGYAMPGFNGFAGIRYSFE
jgi:vitamin B12 transporter